MSKFDSMSDTTVPLNSIQDRAGFFSRLAVPVRHKDKRLAAMLDCSPNMAYRLMRGEGWTAERLALGAKKFGWRWVAAVFGPIAGQGGQDVFAHELASIRSRLDVLSAGFGGGPFRDSRPAVVGGDAARVDSGEIGRPSEEDAAE